MAGFRTGEYRKPKIWPAKTSSDERATSESRASLVALVWRDSFISNHAQCRRHTARGVSRFVEVGNVSKEVVAYLDRVMDTSMAPAAKAMAPLRRDVRVAVEQADGYDAADAALKHLEGKALADGLEDVLVGAMTNGTSAGGVDG